MKLLNIIIKLILLLIILSACKTINNQKSKVPIIHDSMFLSENRYGITIEHFLENFHINNLNQIAEKDFVYDSIKKLSKYKGNSIAIKSIRLVNFFTKKKNVNYEEIIIKDGYPIGLYKASVYKDSTNENVIKTLGYKKGIISGELKIIDLNDSALYQTTFKKGTGYWKDYYYKESKLREEGNVKKNFKEGLWKYYSLSGAIDSTKIYTLKDAVDVRFPYCLFNKKEPCY